jgi:hypothetical protein
MKKIFNKNHDANSLHSNFIGKIFQINKHHVHVDDIIAEGARL